MIVIIKFSIPCIQLKPATGEMNVEDWLRINNMFDNDTITIGNIQIANIKTINYANFINARALISDVDFSLNSNNHIDVVNSFAIDENRNVYNVEVSVDMRLDDSSKKPYTGNVISGFTSFIDIIYSAEDYEYSLIQTEPYYNINKNCIEIPGISIHNVGRINIELDEIRKSMYSPIASRNIQLNIDYGVMQ